MACLSPHDHALESRRLLSDSDIRASLEFGKLVIDPLLEPIQPASIDLRLGNTIVVPQGGHIIDPTNNLGTTDEATVLRTSLHLFQGESILAATLEWIELPADMIGILTGKSTLARYFLQVEAAGYIDPGWKGRPTLEISNLGPDSIILRPGMPICQLRLQTLSGLPPTHLYGDATLGSRYQGSTQVSPALLAPRASPRST
jgi:dCTP deaminase